MASSALTSLPSEVMLMLMTRMPSSSDLLRLVRTSQCMHCVFLCHKKYILGHLIHHLIPKASMSDALAACRAGELASTHRGDESSAATASKHNEFLQKYACGFQYQRRKHHLGSLESLLTLRRLVDRSIRGFLAEVPIDPTANPRLPKPALRSISGSEYARLQKAFFRLETWRKLFARSVDHVRTVHSLQEDERGSIRRFFAIFPPWECEEIVGVYEYLTRVVKMVLRGLQTGVVDQVWTLSEIDDLSMRSEFNRPWARARAFRDLELRGLDIFQDPKRRWIDFRFEYLAVRGLPFLEWLEHIPLNDRLHVMLHCSNQSCPASLVEALRYLNRGYLRSRSWLEQGPADTWAAPPESWTWAHWNRNPSLSRMAVGSEHQHLRAAGYTPSDAERVSKDWGLFAMGPEDSLDPLRRFRRGFGVVDDTLTVKEALEGVPLSKDIFYKVEQALLCSEAFGEALSRGADPPFLRKKSGGFGYAEY